MVFSLLHNGKEIMITSNVGLVFRGEAVSGEYEGAISCSDNK